MTFLGVEFDSFDMAMRVNDTKRMEVTALAKVWSRKTVATKEELQSILGKLDVFNGVELLIPSTVFCNILGDATLAGGGTWNEMEKEYISRRFPLNLQGATVPIHIKEFWMVILAAKVWGPKWTGKRIGIYCDNEAVCKTIIYQKPKDSELQRCLRELLHYVCKYKFQPVILRVSTKDNYIADYISRIYDKPSINSMFLEKGLPAMKQVQIEDDMFNFVADW